MAKILIPQHETTDIQHDLLELVVGIPETILDDSVGQGLVSISRVARRVVSGEMRSARTQ